MTSVETCASTPTGTEQSGSVFLARICKALGHPARLRIIGILRDSGQCACGELVELMPLAQSTVSQHLKVLRDAEIVRAEVDGTKTRYCLNSQRIELFKRNVLLI